MYTDIKSQGLFEIEEYQNDGSSKMSGLHYHSMYEIYYLVKGKRDYIIGDQFFRVQAGEFICVSPFVLHKTDGGSFRCVLISFDTAYLNAHYTADVVEKMLRCFQYKLIRPAAGDDSQLRELLSRLLCQQRTNRSLSFLYLGELLLRLGQMIHNLPLPVPDSPYHIRITKILEYINANYRQIETLDDIARPFYITKYHLCRIFKKATGCSAISYLNDVRIKNACTLLLSTDKTITEIGLSCGFNAADHFCRLFKAAKQLTPSQFRARYREK